MGAGGVFDFEDFVAELGDKGVKDGGGGGVVPEDRVKEVFAFGEVRLGVFLFHEIVETILRSKILHERRRGDVSNKLGK